MKQRIIGRKVSEKEFRLTRLEAELIYYGDAKSTGRTIVVPLPTKPNTGRHICRTGAVLYRASQMGSHPYVLVGAGALETIAMDATTLMPGKGMDKVFAQINRK